MRSTDRLHNEAFKSQGNALVETMLFSLAALPLLLLVPNIGKMSDVNLATIEASRYAVWERTTSDPDQKTDLEIESELKTRFFSDPSIMLLSDRATLSETDRDNSFWLSGRDEDNNPLYLLNASAPIRLRIDNTDIPSEAARTMSRAISTVGEALEDVISNSGWEFDENGFYEATIMAETTGNTNDESGIDCGGQTKKDGNCVRRLYAMLIDDWSSGSPQETERMVRPLVPAGALEPLGNALSKFGNVPVFKELSKMDDMFGRVYADVLPEDRYGDPE